MELFFFLLAVISPVALNVVVWRRLTHTAVGDTSAPWQRLVAYFGLGTNFLAYLIPWGVFTYSYFLLNSGRPVSSDEMIDGALFVNAAVALAALSLVLGALGPKHIRNQQMFSALIVGFFWMSIPRGIL